MLEGPAEEVLKETCFLVEATRCEHLNLWATYAINSPDRSPQTSGHNWEQLNGWGIIVGKLDGMPVSICLTFDRIDGQLVGFWEPISLVIDRRQIDAWFDKHFKGIWKNNRRATTNAMNFNHCLAGIKQANEKRPTFPPKTAVKSKT